MNLDKNLNLLNKVVSVSVKPRDESNSLLKEFTKVYSSPSKISFRQNSTLKGSGLEYSRTLNMLYPGLSENDFQNFHDLLQQKYLINIELENYAVYQISTSELSMRMTTVFDEEVGTSISFKSKTFKKIEYLGLSSSESIIGFPFRLKLDL